MEDIDPRITILKAILDEGRARLFAALDSSPAEAREESPAEGRWSIAAVLEHLAQTEGAVTRLLDGLIETAPHRARDEPFVEHAFARHIAMSYVLDRSRRLVGPQPTGAADADDAWTALKQSRAVFMQVVERAAGRRLEDVFHPHPLLGALDVYEWIAFVGLHESRHADQILEIARELTSDGS